METLRGTQLKFMLRWAALSSGPVPAVSMQHTPLHAENKTPNFGPSFCVAFTFSFLNANIDVHLGIDQRTSALTC